MLAAILRIKRAVVCGCLVVAGLSLISCATDKTVSVVDDPDGKKDSSTIPWNKQEKWEQGADMGGLANSDRAR